MQINVGKHRGKAVFLDTQNAMNGHILLVGKSGSGKTVEAQRILKQVAEQNGTVIAFDMHQTLADDQIFPDYRAFFSKTHCDVDVYRDGLSCELFSPVMYPDGTQECLIDTVNAVVSVFSRIFRLGCNQRVVLRRAMMKMAESGLYKSKGFIAIDEILAQEEDNVAVGLREKLFTFSHRNIFRPGELFLKKGMINIVRLGKFDVATQEMVAELVLAYIWRLAFANKFTNENIWIFVDECQNLSAGRNGILAQLLSEGRKFGLKLILVTQQFMQEANKQPLITQCASILLFQPDANRVNCMARMIAPSSTKDWIHLLASLKRGEFVLLGETVIGGKSVNAPIKVSAVESNPSVNGAYI